MNINYIALIFILFIIILIGIQLVYENIEGLYDGQIDYTTTVSGAQISTNVNTTDLSKWNINELKANTRAIGYTVSDWSTHLDIFINRLGCPFYGYDTRISKWNNRRFVTLRWNSYNIRRRIRINRFSWWINWWVRYPRQEWRDNWINNLQFISAYKVDMESYRFLLGEIMYKAQIKNDLDLQKQMNLNMSEQFTTIEGLEPGSVTNLDIIKKRDRTDAVNVNLTKMLINRNYSVPSNEFPAYAKENANQGKSLKNIGASITTMKSFGIHSENVRKYMSNLINDTLNKKKHSLLDLDTLISTYFGSYGITNASDFIDPSTVDSPGGVKDGNFTVMVKRFNLHRLNIPLFPTTTSSTECIMHKLKEIYGANIPTIGKDPNGVFYTNNFLQGFQIYNINSSQFFNRIYSNYSLASIQSSTKSISETLRYVTTFSPSNLINAFQRLTRTLKNTNLSFNEYVSYITISETRFGVPPRHLIERTWMKFVEYYTNRAYSDLPNFVSDNPVKPNTLTKFLDDIDKYYSKNAPKKNKVINSTYFAPGRGEFEHFLQVAIYNNYKVSDIKRDIELGQSYPHLISMYNTIPKSVITSTPTNSNQNGFCILSSSQEPSIDDETTEYSEIEDTEVSMDTQNSTFTYVYNEVLSFVRYFMNGFASEKEGFAISPADAYTLKSFGIVDYGSTLTELETTLKMYNIDDINKSNTTWQNMMSFLILMVSIGISNSDFNDFIKVLVLFGANTVVKWVDILKRLSSIQIKGGVKVKAFLIKITSFGVKYEFNFNSFIEYLNRFNANLEGELNSVNRFIDDMIMIDNTYSTPGGTAVVNSIITYFSNYTFTLTMYYSNDSFTIDKCNQTLPKNFPSLLVNSLYEYNKVGSYGNELYDIQSKPDSKMFEICDVVDSVQEAYMLANDIQTYNDKPAVIVPNVKIIVSFLYKEEMDAIIAQSTQYNDIKKRIAMINGVADGMMKYAVIFKPNNQNNYDLYNNIIKCLRIFPVLAFQYISNELISKCNGSDCLYSIYVDPVYTECKASTVKQTINYRPNSPVL